MLSHNDKSETCITCGHRFTFYRNLLHHQEIHARAAHKYLCDLCGKTCQYYSDLRTHVAGHLQDSLGYIEGYNFKCSICSKLYADKSSLQRHAHVTHGTSFSYTCWFCGSLWETSKHLSEHMTTHYKKINGMYCCNICDKRFLSRYILVEHMHAVHWTMGKEKRNICQWCGETFMRHSNLWGHEKRVHTPKGADYQCDKCGKSFTTKGKLVVHLVTHNGIKKYSCKVCGKEFGQQSSLRRHKPIHTGEKKHSCSYCDFKCIQLYSLKRHILTHTGQKPHECDMCGEQFRQIFALTKHKRKHHLVS